MVKTNFFGGGGGGSDIKMGCTIYWKIFPVKRARGVYISVVHFSSLLNWLMGFPRIAMLINTLVT